jgi:glycosyltransferase involved in cell wall biosynthesis
VKVLALTRYAQLGASSRLRTRQFAKYLEAQGIYLQLEPFFDDAYIKAIYGTDKRSLSVVRHFTRRASVLFRCADADAIWLEKEAFPWLPWVIEGACLPRSIPLIVDYDDAIFHRYDMHTSGMVRALLGKKIDSVMRRADLVLAGNDYLAERARAAQATRVEVIPTVIDLERYTPTEPKPDSAPIVIGWIGSPNTAPYLAQLNRLLSELATRHPISCVAIGARQDQLTGGPFVAKDWSEAEEVELLNALDIGIMPLPDDPWTRGKCGYKLIQYMACSLPVVASPVGANNEIVRDGENGFLASTDQEWSEALIQLILDQKLRRRMGIAGRTRVESEFSLQFQAPHLEQLLRSAITNTTRAA